MTDTTKPQIQEAQRLPNRIKITTQKTNNSKYIIFKLLKN